MLGDERGGEGVANLNVNLEISFSGIYQEKVKEFEFCIKKASSLADELANMKPCEVVIKNPST